MSEENGNLMQKYIEIGLPHVTHRDGDRTMMKQNSFESSLVVHLGSCQTGELFVAKPRADGFKPTVDTANSWLPTQGAGQDDL